MADTCLLILAAGMGSRYGGLKQIDPVGSYQQAIMDYSLFDAYQAGIKKAVFVIRRDIEEDMEKLVGKYRHLLDIQFAFQELSDLPEGLSVPEGREKPWGTGQAVLSARNLVKENFLVINADDFYGRESYKTAQQFLSTTSDDNLARYAIVAYELGKTLSEHGTVSRGVCEANEEGYLLNIVERTKIQRQGDMISHQEDDGSSITFAEDAPTSMNMFCFTSSIFTHLKKQFTDFVKANQENLKAEFYMPAVASSLIATNEATVEVLRTPEQWFGVTYREDKEQVQAKIKELTEAGVYPDNLAQG